MCAGMRYYYGHGKLCKLSHRSDRRSLCLSLVSSHIIIISISLLHGSDLNFHLLHSSIEWTVHTTSLISALLIAMFMVNFGHMCYLIIIILDTIYCTT